MLLNKANIKNPYIKKWIPSELQKDVKKANKWLWQQENKGKLIQVVIAEENRLKYFKDSPITNIDEVFKTLSVTYKFLSNWDKEFIVDMVDHNFYSIKQKALILRIASSINYAMWKNDLDREWLWNQIKEDEVKIIKTTPKTYDEETVTETELTDETELVDDFEILKADFDDVMESKLYDHQTLTVNFLMTREDGNGIVASSTGCVDCDTEFFNGKKWKKISEYNDGDKVLQYNEDGTAELVYPSQYHKYPAKHLTLMNSKYGVNQCISNEHNMIYQSSKGNLCKKKFSELKEMHLKSKSGFSGRFYTTFTPKINTNIDLTDDEIRVMVAVIADGHFPNKTNNCRVNLKKEAKQKRLISLLENANIEYQIHQWNPKDMKYKNFMFKAPIKIKYFDESWFNCSLEQLKVICDEAKYWDSSVNYTDNNVERIRFSTTIKESADFIQYAYTSLGYRASIKENNRIGQMYKNNKYIRKSIEYLVNITKRNTVCIGNQSIPENIPKMFTEYKTKDGYKYCFTVNSGMLVLRRDGKINITGNSGKSLVGITYAEQLFLENKINHTYIICPLSMVETWRREILKHSRLKDISKYTIINYEKILSMNFDNTENSLALLDEAHKLKNNLSKRYIEFMKYKWKYVVPMSATIVANNLKELKNIYGLMNKKAPIKYGEIDLPKLKNDLIRVPKSKLNLPQFIKKDIPVKVNFEEEYNVFQQDVVDSIENEKSISIKDGKRPSNALVKLLRLNQYCSNRNIVMEKQLPIEEQNKFKVMLELIDDMDKDQQLIIWSNFVDTIKNIETFLSEYFSCKVIYGQTKKEERDKIMDNFKSKKFKILVANPSTLNAGITLINTNKMIYFDRDFSMIKYAQSMGRIHRIGQDKECTMYNLFYKNTIEEYIIDKLNEKESMINEVLENGTNTEKITSKDILDKLKEG